MGLRLAVFLLFPFFIAACGGGSATISIDEENDGIIVEINDGDADGSLDGDVDGNPDGEPDGDIDGSSDGDPDGSNDGDPDGSNDGNPDGSNDGDPDGSNDGDPDGSNDGDPDGSNDGNPDGSNDGDPDGSSDGDPDGSNDGDPDGDDDIVPELSISVDADNTTLQTGTGSSFTITIINESDTAQASDVTINLERLYTDNCVNMSYCDGQATLASISVPQGSCTTGDDQFECDLESIAPDASITIEGELSGTSPGFINFAFSVNASGSDNDYGIDTDYISWTIYPSYLNSGCASFTTSNSDHLNMKRASSCQNDKHICTTGDNYDLGTISGSTEEVSSIYMGDDGLSYSTYALCTGETEINFSDTATEVIAPALLPNTENIAFTSDGRMFVAVASTPTSRIVEIHKSGENYTESTVIDSTSCIFGGLTAKGNILYAGCSSSPSASGTVTLFRIDPDNAQDAQPQTLPTSLINYANGMAFDSNGTLYISNSFATSSFWSSKPSITRITITSENPFTVESESWLASNAYSSDFQNGIQIIDNDMYFADASNLYHIPINTDGSAGQISQVYTVTKSYWIDDIGVFPGYVAISKIPDPYEFNSNLTGSVEILDIDSFEVVNSITPASGVFKPSSVMISNSETFGIGNLFVTDYFNGGLYIIEQR